MHRIDIVHIPWADFAVWTMAYGGAALGALAAIAFVIAPGFDTDLALFSLVSFVTSGIATIWLIATRKNAGRFAVKERHMAR